MFRDDEVDRAVVVASVDGIVFGVASGYGGFVDGQQHFGAQRRNYFQLPGELGKDQGIERRRRVEVGIDAYARRLSGHERHRVVRLLGRLIEDQVAPEELGCLVVLDIRDPDVVTELGIVRLELGIDDVAEGSGIGIIPVTAPVPQAVGHVDGHLLGIDAGPEIDLQQPEAAALGRLGKGDRVARQGCDGSAHGAVEIDGVRRMARSAACKWVEDDDSRDGLHELPRRSSS